MAGQVSAGDELLQGRCWGSLRGVWAWPWSRTWLLLAPSRPQQELAKSRGGRASGHGGLGRAQFCHPLPGNHFGQLVPLCSGQGQGIQGSTCSECAVGVAAAEPASSQSTLNIYLAQHPLLPQMTKEPGHLCHTHTQPQSCCPAGWTRPCPDNRLATWGPPIKRPYWRALCFWLDPAQAPFPSLGLGPGAAEGVTVLPSPRLTGCFPDIAALHRTSFLGCPQPPCGAPVQAAGSVWASLPSG